MSRAAVDSSLSFQSGKIVCRSSNGKSCIFRVMGGVVNEALSPKTILVVDDEEKVRESVKEVLTDEGYRVLDTADGTRVLEMIEEEQPGLVLLDIWMPKIDGIGLL